MGGGSFTSTDWEEFKSTETRDRLTGEEKTREEIFSRGTMNPDFDPRKIKIRESCDSADNPNSTPIIVALDVTGSMHKIPEALVRDGLGTLATEILQRKPVSNPHIMFMAVGDAAYDSAPLQATQFEADIRIAAQLKELYLEGGGGPNPDESYNLPWYFAAKKTSIDSFKKRGEKGYLFTIGDEGVPKDLTAEQIRNVFGDEIQGKISSKELLRMVQERYHVFHLVIQQGHNYERDPDYVNKCWKNLLDQNVIPVSDYTKVPQIIVSMLELMAGKPKADITKSWDGSTSLAVRNAIKDITAPGAEKGTGGVWRPPVGEAGGDSAAPLL